MKIIYIAWRNPVEKSWLPVGRLTFTDGVYYFVYTRGALRSKDFIPFGRMRKLNEVYKSTELFPLFSNRLLSKSRPEYKDFLHWLKLRENEATPLALLALTEGKRETDSLEIFPCPEKNDKGRYSMSFFVHGIRYLKPKVVNTVNGLKVGDPLLLMPDPKNHYDRYAIAIIDKKTIVLGYSPRYLTNEFHYLLEVCDSKDITVQVEQVNLDAPLQLRLLCQIKTPWPEDFKPCSSEDYLPITTDAESKT